MDQPRDQAGKSRRPIALDDGPLARQRRRAEKLLQAQRDRILEAEQLVAGQLDRLVADGVAAALPTPVRSVADSRQRADALNRETEHLERARRELADAQKSFHEQQQQFEQRLRAQQAELDSRRAEIDRAAQATRQLESDLQAAQARHDASAQRIAAREAACAELERRLATEQEQLEHNRQQTKNQRRRIADELRDQRTAQLREISRLRQELELAEQSGRQRLDLATKQLEHDTQQSQQALDRQRQDLDKRQQELERLRQDADRREQELYRSQLEQDRRKSELESQAAQIAQQRRQLQQDLEQSASDSSTQIRLLQQQLEHARSELTKAEHWALELDSQAAEFRRAHERLETEHRALKHQYAELEQRAADLDRRHGDMQRQAVGEEGVRVEFAHQHNDLERRHQQLENDYRQLEEQYGQLDSQLTGLRVERDELLERLSNAASPSEPPAADGELQRRFEMAVDDARSLKRRNSELEEQVMALKASAALDPSRSSSQATDWETTKQRLLASLAAELDETPQRKEERATIESTIAITDDIVAQKDAEIAELQLMLAQQSSNIGAMAVGASAIDAALQQDELIRQEREKLAQLEAEWREKLRHAEIDISVERAKIARERAEMEEKQQALEALLQQQHQSPDAAHPGDPASKNPRGRWLSRLGLKE